MNAWINLGALAKIVVVGLLTGAGLPALFACALWLLNPLGPSTEDAARPTAGPARRALAGLIFALVLAAIGWGISVIVDRS
ncbi:hypothetical protein [Kitasatospora sp. CB01950]|uniref:hypothetical protein n=1 Tax=Kitasatospora sp. CB01950 TaxID=1703930 RepID=UPI00093E76CF|nr:hypothetical protein [Kitasatospora sp. CB01950]OKJ13902.1 hypothetical protein AMK19_11045 [Kitasatospora sp. CB01950]